jgi:glyoxylase-like metal-dependent hydrolase (beta-lactamase superfamily II)
MAEQTATGVREVAEGIFAVPAPFWGFPLSLYFIRSGDRWTVIDTGIATTPEESIVPFLDEHASGVDALDLVLLTHGHVDHIGGNGSVKALAPHVRFALHERDLGWAENVDRHYLQLYAAGEPAAWTPDAEFEAAIRTACGEPVAIDVILAGGETVDIGGGRTVEVHHIAGHAPGHVVFRDTATNTVFCGDALQGSGAMNAQTGKRDFPMYRTVRDYRAALEKVRALGADRLCTGHAGVLSGEEIEPAIDASRAWSDDFHEMVAALARRERSFTLAEMVEAVLRERPEHAQLLQGYVTTAEHLDELVRTGDLHPEMADGVKRWTVTES